MDVSVVAPRRERSIMARTAASGRCPAPSTAHQSSSSWTMCAGSLPRRPRLCARFRVRNGEIGDEEMSVKDASGGVLGEPHGRASRPRSCDFSPRFGSSSKRSSTRRSRRSRPTRTVSLPAPETSRASPGWAPLTPTRAWDMKRGPAGRLVPRRTGTSGRLPPRATFAVGFIVATTRVPPAGPRSAAPSGATSALPGDVSSSRPRGACRFGARAPERRTRGGARGPPPAVDADARVAQGRPKLATSRSTGAVTPV